MHRWKHGAHLIVNYDKVLGFCAVNLQDSVFGFCIVAPNQKIPLEKTKKMTNILRDVMHLVLIITGAFAIRLSQQIVVIRSYIVEESIKEFIICGL